MPRGSKDNSRDWKSAAEKCLTTALQKAEEAVSDGAIEKVKSFESLIKTVGDVVGAGLYLNRSQRTAASSGAGSSDDDD